MALGVDTYAAQIIIELKKKYPHITLECVIPCESQSDKWKGSEKERYYKILSIADEKILLQRKYTSDCMQKRNFYMIDRSDFVLAVWNGLPSGTGNTVKYAEMCGKKVIRINPKELERSI